MKIPNGTPGLERWPITTGYSQQADDLQRLIYYWDPSYRRRHCSNCLHARVVGISALPETYCNRGHGDGQHIDLARLLRMKHPRAFRLASECSDYEEADE